MPKLGDQHAPPTHSNAQRQSFVLIRVGQLPQPLRLEVTPSSFTAEELGLDHNGTHSNAARVTVRALKRRLLAAVNAELERRHNTGDEGAPPSSSTAAPFCPFGNCRVLRRGVELQDTRPIEASTFTNEEHLQVLLTERRGADVGQSATSALPPPPAPTTSSAAGFPVLARGVGSVPPPAAVPSPQRRANLTAEEVAAMRSGFTRVVNASTRNGANNEEGGGESGARPRPLPTAASTAAPRAAAMPPTAEDAIPRPGTTAAAAMPTRLVDEANEDGDGAASAADGGGPMATVEANRLRLRGIFMDSQREPMWRLVAGFFIGFFLNWPSLVMLCFFSTSRKDGKRGVTGQYVRYRQGPSGKERRAARAVYKATLRRAVDESVASTFGITSANANGGDSLIAVPPPSRRGQRREATDDDENDEATISTAQPQRHPLAGRGPNVVPNPPSAPQHAPQPFFALEDNSTQVSAAYHAWAVASGLLKLRIGVVLGVLVNLLVGALTTASVNSLVTSSG